MVVYLTFFYTKQELALRTAYLFVSAAIAGSLGGKSGSHVFTNAFIEDQAYYSIRPSSIRNRFHGRLSRLLRVEMDCSYIVQAV